MKRLIHIILAILICASLSVGACAEELLISTNPSSQTTINFTDVDRESVSGQAIYKLVEAGILLGDGNGTFRPHDSITRAELTKIVNMIFNYTELDETGFSDVTENDWYYTNVLIAKKAGYIVGFGDGTFRGEEKVSREQACTILCRVASLYDLSINFEIKDEVSDWAMPYVQKVLANALMTLEADGTFRATENITRSEFSVTYANFYTGGNTENKDSTDDNSTNSGSSGGGSGSSGGGSGSSGGGSGSSGGGSGSSGGGSGSSGGDSGSSGDDSTGGDSTGGDSTGDDSTGDDSTGGDSTDGDSTGGDSTDGDSTGGDSAGDSSSDNEEIDYEEVNREMLANLQLVSDDIDEYYYEFARGNQRNLIKIIKDCIDATIIAASSEVITSDFVRTTFETEIDSAKALYNTIIADESQKTSFYESLGKLNTATINWLANEFGIVQ